MPYSVRKAGSKWEVVNTTTGKVHAKHTTKAKAEAQVRLLRGKDHGWEPDRVKYLSDGTKVNVHFTGKGSSRGKAK